MGSSFQLSSIPILTYPPPPRKAETVPRPPLPPPPRTAATAEGSPKGISDETVDGDVALALAARAEEARHRWFSHACSRQEGVFGEPPPLRSWPVKTLLRDTGGPCRIGFFHVLRIDGAALWRRRRASSTGRLGGGVVAVVVADEGVVGDGGSLGAESGGSAPKPLRGCPKVGRVWGRVLPGFGVPACG